MSNKLCKICSTDSQQVKMLIFCLRKKLLNIGCEYVPDFKQQVLNESRHKDSFKRLLSIIFGDSSIKKGNSLHCSHQKLMRYFKRKLKCDNTMFQNICNELSQELAEKNYHLEIIHQQVKQLKESSERIALEKESKNEQNVKIEAEEVISFMGKENIENQFQQNKNLQAQLEVNKSEKKQHFNYFPVYYYPPFVDQRVYTKLSQEYPLERTKN